MFVNKLILKKNANPGLILRKYKVPPEKPSPRKIKHDQNLF